MSSWGQHYWQDSVNKPPAPTPSRDRSRSPTWNSGPWEANKWTSWKDQSTDADEVKWDKPTPDRHLPMRSPTSRPSREDRTPKEDRGPSPGRQSSSKNFLNKEDIPSAWESDEFYLDKRKTKDLPFPRCISATEWAQSKGIAGAPIHCVPLVSVVYKGIDNWMLRHLASGRLTYFVLAKTYSMSQFLYNIGKFAKDLDMETTMQTWGRSKNINCTTNEEKKLLVEQFAKHVVESFCNKPNDPELLQKISELECKLLDANKDKDKGPQEPPGPISDYEWSKGKPKFLAFEAPAAMNKQEIAAWVSKQVPKKETKAFDSKLSKLKSVVAKLDEDVQEEAIKVALIEWGLPVSMATKANTDSGTKILCAIALAQQ